MSDKDSERQVGAIRRFAEGLSFPKLFAFTAALFLADLAVPDVIPFVDEILLGLLTTVLGLLRTRRRSATASTVNGVETPPDLR